MDNEEEGYLHDVFVTYKSDEAVRREWVVNRFVPKLRDKLKGEMPPGWKISKENSVFVDREGLQVGDDWNVKLRNKLRSTRILVAVLTPDYFTSKWCMREWESFVLREKRFYEQGIIKNDKRLIFTVTYSDGTHFPEFATAIQSNQDYSRFTSPYGFEQSKRYLKFDDAVQSFAKILQKRLLGIPAWQNDFPIQENPTIYPFDNISNPKH